jgi:hypothetical protein
VTLYDLCHINTGRDRGHSTPFSGLIDTLDYRGLKLFSPEIHVLRRALADGQFKICAKAFFRVLVVGSW